MKNLHNSTLLVYIVYDSNSLNRPGKNSAPQAPEISASLPVCLSVSIKPPFSTSIHPALACHVANVTLKILLGHRQQTTGARI